MAFFDKAIGNSVQIEGSSFVSALIKLITYAKSEVRALRMVIEILYRLNGDISSVQQTHVSNVLRSHGLQSQVRYTFLYLQHQESEMKQNLRNNPQGLPLLSKTCRSIRMLLSTPAKHQLLLRHQQQQAQRPQRQRIRVHHSR